MAAKKFGPKTLARTELVETIRRRHLRRALGFGLTRADLDDIARHGRQAEKADRLQTEQLRQIAEERSALKALRASVYNREEGLRARLLPIIGDLRAAGNHEVALRLALLPKVLPSLRRNRTLDSLVGDLLVDEAFTSVEAVVGSPPENPPSSARARPSPRMQRVVDLCEALLADPFEPARERLAVRAFPDDELRRLYEDARRVVEAGLNGLRPVEATAVEAAAVAAQDNLWSQLRLMLRNTVRGVPALERKWGEC